MKKENPCFYCGKNVDKSEAMFDLSNPKYKKSHVRCHSKNNKPLIKDPEVFRRLLNKFPGLVQ